MRNLKRALSLALAAIMVLGMMVIGAGAANVYDSFPDKEEIVNKDAVSMLTTLGIINGEDSGKFNPTGNVTRSQMAKMISVIMNKGADNNALYADVNSGLTDIGSSWAKGHINFCFTRGIIAGRGDGKFDPEANVTAAEAAKMLLVAAGYDPAKEGFTGGDWAVNVSAMASKLGVYNNYEKSTMDPLSRDDAALLIYNALDVEMIQKYDSNYPIAFGDHRTILSVMYGVYKMQGVVISNEEAALNGTDSEDASPVGKTTLEEVKIYASTTENTTTGEYEEIKGQVTLNTSTTADMLGKTVTLYVKKTTILANSTVMGVFLRDDNNVVKTTTESQDTMKDFLKNSGMSVNDDTAYYVNYGHVASEAAATKDMGFATTTKGDRYTSLNDNGKDVNTNGSGVEMTAIDNDNDGKVDYVLYTQETLTQVVATNTNKDTTTLNDFNKNKAIDNDKIVTEETLAEGDVVLTVAYGGKYYVSAPEVVTGKMDSFSSSKTKEQYIEVGGTKYYPSYDKFSADSANNTYVFNVLNCGKTDGVDFDIDYDFLLDSAGTVIAYRPSEKSLYNYALILDSGYDPGRTNSNPNGEVKVLLPDGTEGTYTLNFTASAQNIGDQLFSGLTSSQRKDNGMEELKGFLGSSVTDNTDSKPDGALPYAYGTPSTRASHYSDNVGGNKAGHAKGYVVGYSLNDANVLTITSIVGSNNVNSVGDAHYNPTSTTEKPHSTAKTLSSDYDTGSARVKYTGGQLTIDQNTVAYYYTKVNGDTVYGVAVGYSKMADVKASDADHNSFVAATVKDSALAASILFNAEGVVAEKDYAFVLSRSSTVSGYITLNVVLMDGTASTLKVERSDWDAIVATHGDNAYNTVYSYTTKNDVSEVAIGTDSRATEVGYAKKLRDGTVAFYKKNASGIPGAYVDAYSYDKNIWNVEGISTGDNAPGGAFAENIYKETILVLDSKENTVRAAYIKSVYGGTVSEDHNFDWNLTNYTTLYPYHTVVDMNKAFDEGHNVLVRGDYNTTTLGAGTSLYIPAGRIIYVDGNLTMDAGHRVYGGGTLWVSGNLTANRDIEVSTQVGKNLVLGAATVTVYSGVSIAGNLTTAHGTEDLVVAADADVYVTKDVIVDDLQVDGHIDAHSYDINSGTVGSTHTLIARGDVDVANIFSIGDATDAGSVTVAGVLSATTLNIVNGTLNLTKNGVALEANTLNVKADGKIDMTDSDIDVTNLTVDNGGSVEAENVKVTGVGQVDGGLKLDGTLDTVSTGTVTLGGTGSISAAKVEGSNAVVNTNGGSLTTTDSTSALNVKGQLSGTYAGDVTLKDNSTVAENKSAAINGTLACTSYTLTVTGELVLNGTVDDVSKLAGAGTGKVTFGSKADVSNSGTNKFYYSNGTDLVPVGADFRGLTFKWNATASKFVATVAKPDVSTPDATANVNFALTQPAADGGANTIVINQSATPKTVTVNVANDTAAVVITATKANSNQRIAVRNAASGLVSVSGNAYTVNTNDVKDAGGDKTFSLVVSEADKESITYTVTVTVAAPAPLDPTANVTFALTTPGSGAGNSLAGGGASRTVTVGVVNTTNSVVITGTKTANQTVTVGGAGSNAVTTEGTATAPTYTVDTSTIASTGGEKEFTLKVSEGDKADITYTVTVTVAAPAVIAKNDVNANLTAPGNGVECAAATTTGTSYTTTTAWKSSDDGTAYETAMTNGTDQFATGKHYQAEVVLTAKAGNVFSKTAGAYDSITVGGKSVNGVVSGDGTTLTLTVTFGELQ